MSDLNHQDWEPVILKKPTSNRPKKVNDFERVNGMQTVHTMKQGGGKNSQNLNYNPTGMSKVQKAALDNDGLTEKIETVDRKISQNIQRARQAEGLTQKELAQKVNQPLTVIQDYESGKAIPNANLINKLEKVLKTKLRT